MTAALAAEGHFVCGKEFPQRLKPIGGARVMYELKLVPFIPLQPDYAVKSIARIITPQRKISTAVIIALVRPLCAAAVATLAACQ
jgi:hypothetical protein